MFRVGDKVKCKIAWPYYDLSSHSRQNMAAYRVFEVLGIGRNSTGVEMIILYDVRHWPDVEHIWWYAEPFTLVREDTYMLGEAIS